ncbi:MAG: phosphoribosyltransferase family protein, partial [Myxococcota bacterium]
GFVFKRRTGTATEVTALAADVRGKTVVMYDDMIRTGGSLIGAAKAYREAGAARIAAVATHGVLPGAVLERIEASGLFSRLACTDTHPRARALGEARPDFLQVEKVAPLLAAALGPGGKATLRGAGEEDECDASK